MSVSYLYSLIRFSRRMSLRANMKINGEKTANHKVDNSMRWMLSIKKGTKIDRMAATKMTASKHKLRQGLFSRKLVHFFNIYPLSVIIALRM